MGLTSRSQVPHHGIHPAHMLHHAAAAAAAAAGPGNHQHSARRSSRPQTASSRRSLARSATASMGRLGTVRSRSRSGSRARARARGGGGGGGGGASSRLSTSRSTASSVRPAGVRAPQSMPWTMATSGEGHGHSGGARKPKPRLGHHNLPPVADLHSRGHGHGHGHGHGRSKARRRKSASAVGAGGKQGGHTADRLARLEAMLTDMQRDRARLSHTLQSEARARKQVEDELRHVKDNMAATLRANSNAETKLRAYRDIMSPLVQALGASSKRPGSSAR